jgi:DNA-binding NarL/FixJ family response regulator
VVDDHPIVRQGLALLINREPDLVVCGEAEEAMGAMHVLASARPDVLIVDISLNGPDGLDLLKTFAPLIPLCRC